MAASKKKAKKKAAKKKQGKWGGRREGAGRKKGTGTGQSPLSRRNRVAVMLTDKELKALKRQAKAQGVPVSTCAYLSVEGSLVRSGWIY